MSDPLPTNKLPDHKAELEEQGRRVAEVLKKEEEEERQHNHNISITRAADPHLTAPVPLNKVTHSPHSVVGEGTAEQLHHGKPQGEGASTTHHLPLYEHLHGGRRSPNLNPSTTSGSGSPRLTQRHQRIGSGSSSNSSPLAHFASGSLSEDSHPPPSLFYYHRVVSERERVFTEIVGMVREVLLSWIKGFGYASLAKTILSLFSALRFRSVKHIVLIDPSFGNFMGVLSAGFKLVLYIFRIIRAKADEDDLSLGVAGFVAGGAALYFLDKDDRSSIALFSFVRVIYFLCRCFYNWWTNNYGIQQHQPNIQEPDKNHNQHHSENVHQQATEPATEQKEASNINSNASVLPHWLRKTLDVLIKFDHWDVVMMMISASPLLYSYVLDRDTLQPTYRKFLIKHGAKSLPALDLIESKLKGLSFDMGAMKRHFAIHKFPLSNFINQWYSSIAGHELSPECRIIHPHMNCATHFFWFTFWGMLRSFSVYFPVHTFYAAYVLLRSIAVTRRLPPLHKIGVKLAKNIFFSCLFLSVYCATAWACPCSGVNIFHLPTPHPLTETTMRLLLMIPGIATLLEYKSRRIELALYCLPRALETSYNLLRKKGYIRKALTGGEYVLMSMAMSGAIWCWYKHPSVIKPIFKYFMDLFWTPNFNDTSILPAYRVKYTASAKDRLSRRVHTSIHVPPPLTLPNTLTSSASYAALVSLDQPNDDDDDTTTSTTTNPTPATDNTTTTAPTNTNANITINNGTQSQDSSGPLSGDTTTSTTSTTSTTTQ